MSALDKYILNPISGKVVLDTPKRRNEIIKSGKTPIQLNPNEYSINPKTGKPSKINKKKDKTREVKEDSPAALPIDILEQIAHHADSGTKRRLKETNKYFKETVKVSPTFGQNNYNNIIKYIMTTPDSEKSSTLFLMDWKGEGPKQHIDFLKEEIDGRPGVKRLTITKNLKIGKPIIIGTQEYIPNDKKFKLNITKTHRDYFSKFINDRLVHVNMDYKSQEEESYSFIMNTWNDKLVPKWKEVFAAWRKKEDIRRAELRKTLAN